MNAIADTNNSSYLPSFPVAAHRFLEKRPVGPYSLDFDWIGAVNSYLESTRTSISARILQFKADLAGNPQLAEQIYQIVNCPTTERRRVSHLQS